MIIDKDSNQPVRDHANSFFQGGKFEAEDVPWVKVGNLYMSICITGENSWVPLAKDLSAGSKVVVFTGRHGEATGNPTNQFGRIVDKLVYDIEHLKQDRKIVDGLKSQGHNVELLDLYEANDKRTTERLRELIRDKLDRGNVVILAWCFSLFAMDQFKSEIAKTTTAQRIANTNFDKTVKSIVFDRYSWVPKA
ncbi:hypothetical protein DXX93_14735 [Thalassotalea euphylliae]|uniref:Uncharacterized protein n=1 Tax=Thalassotalea euphylliae TaxID=1655234 RepID=A0A3E0TT28_9GAMM|nr:hypothetical protein [Thalassotalea euphylliae]REL27688.1 hypothetical protein DXX93_14735 [Thalassotalea euphylliae]